MNPALKKVMTAVAVKEVVDRIQAVRKPRQSFVRRHAGAIAILAVGTGAAILWTKRNQIKGSMAGNGMAGERVGYKDQFPTGPVTEPAATTESNGHMESSTVV
jgi:hypothetical protein